MANRILHGSDWHGYFPDLSRHFFDIIVLSGDLLPDHPDYRSISRQNNANFQYNWAKDNIENYKKMFQKKPVFFVFGNHDWIDPIDFEKLLRENSIEAHSLENKIINYNNINFYGFPYIPYINGTFNYEKTPPEMKICIDKMVDSLNENYVDVLVSHAPPFKCLDLDYRQNERFGSTAISDALDYKIKEEMLPNCMMFGHIHSSHGVSMRNGILCSNAATTKNLIDL